MPEKWASAELPSILVSYADKSWKQLEEKVHFVLTELYTGDRFYSDIYFYVWDLLLAAVRYPVE